MTYVVRINTENAAFDGENLEEEIALLLRQVANHIGIIGARSRQTLRDTNGNVCGQAFLVK